jgi:hypothetical protein
MAVVNQAIFILTVAKSIRKGHKRLSKETNTPENRPQKEKGLWNLP